MDIHNPKCFANHCGLYAIEPMFLLQTVRQIKQGIFKVKTNQQQDDDPDDTDSKGNKRSTVPYNLIDGVCIMELCGPSMKMRSKFGGYSTIDARRTLNYAVKDPACNSILLLVDSPGGAVAGTEAFALAVSSADRAKPVHAHFDDLGASAALWIASQARKVTTNATAMVGSIGTLAVLEDTSKKAEMEGVKVHVISTGPLKGAGTEGTPVTKEIIDYYQSLVDDTNAYFIAAIAEGRRMAKKDVQAIATGALYTAKEAQKLGLVDEISSSDDAMRTMLSKYTPKQSKSGMRADADTLIRLAEAE